MNGAIHIECSIMKNVMASAAEAEVGAAFKCAQDGVPVRMILHFLGHIQPPTPITTDNQCTEGIINGTVKQKRSKAMGMRFYWLQDRVNQGQYSLHWKPGASNLGDYFTKHFSPAHHRRIRPIYLYEPQAMMLRLQNCPYKV